MAKLDEALELVEWIKAGKPVPCSKGPADEYMIAMADEIAKLRTAIHYALRFENFGVQGLAKLRSVIENV